MMLFLGDQAWVNTEVFLFLAVFSARAAMKVFQFIESMLDISVLVSTFVKGTGWLFDVIEFGWEQKTMNSLPRVA